MTRKRFGISSSIGRGITETISIAEQGAGVFRNTIIPMSRIELDPENPRKILLSIEDIKSGLSINDPLYIEKFTELEKLRGLANTIESRGLIQPIAVYKYNEQYRIVAGHRRFMASLIAKKNEIEARVFNEKPKKLDLKLVQLIENTSREDLSLVERLNNVKEIISEFVTNNSEDKITAEKLRELTGLSLTSAKCYLAVLNGPEDVLTAVLESKIQSLDKAALIAHLTDEEVRKKAIIASIEGANREQLKQLINSTKENKRLAMRKLSTRGRNASRVSMGNTNKIEVVQLMVNAVLEQPKFGKYKEIFKGVEWKNYKQVSQAFKKFILSIEKELII